MTAEVLIRDAGPRDAHALRRLAGRDSAPVPAHPVLVAEVGGELLAAISLADGTPVADPFRRSRGLVDLLELRAWQLGEEARRPRRPEKLRECPRATPSIEPLAA